MTTNTNASNKKEESADTIETLKKTGAGLFQKLRLVLRGMGFWKMALICAGLRFFVAYPLGQLSALLVGSVWCFENWSSVGHFFRSIGGKASGTVKGVAHASYSMWYEQEGEQLIDALVRDLSGQGLNYCNLPEHINMPPESHWHAISAALGKKGIRSQVTKDAFYIGWNHSNPA